MGGCVCVFAQSTGNANGNEGEAVEEITKDGPIDTLPNLGSSALKKPKQKRSVSRKELSADWRAGCGRAARPVRREGCRCKSASLPLSANDPFPVRLKSLPPHIPAPLVVALGIEPAALVGDQNNHAALRETFDHL